MGHYDDLYEFYKSRPCPLYETGIIDREQYLVRKKIKKKPQTNEEWFCGLSTWEKATVIAHKFFGGDEDECQKMYYYFGDWLKAVHK